MDRITTNSLERRLDGIRHKLGRTDETWKRQADGTLKATIGNLELDHMGAGYSLELVCSDGGGVHNLSLRYSGKEMDAFLRGFAEALNLKKTEDWILR